MNRKELDAFVEHHQLSASNVDLALTLARARPTQSETHRFAIRVLLLAGILSLAAGVVFFVAANWDVLRVAGRFALLEVLIVVSVVLALLRPPPRATGRYALLTAFVTTGALLALFGQTYQTGADVYELFLMWTAIGLPFVLAGQWSVLWAAWVLVLNIALALFCGFRPDGGLLWVIFSPTGLTTSGLLLIAAVVNLALWSLAEFASKRAPDWLRRLVLTCALTFATWAGCLATVGREENGVNVLWVLLMLVAVGLYTARRRSDVFPLALIAGSIISMGTALIAELSPPGWNDTVGTAFMLAFWLIISSTASGRTLMHLMRKWRAAGASA